MGGDPQRPFNHLIAMEGGGTRTVVLRADSHGQILQRLALGPLNLKLSTDKKILSVLRQFNPTRASICLAGCRTETDRKRIRKLAHRAWPQTKSLFIGNDLDSGYAAAFGRSAAGILVICGTGSCVYGRKGKRTAKAGGWGHILGDRGSAYWIAHRNLQAALADFDRTGKSPRLLQKILRRLCLNSPEQLTDWIQRATKSDMAALACECFSENPQILAEAADQLAADCVAVARRLRLTAPAVALAGGVFDHQRKFFKLVARKIHDQIPQARVGRPKFESALGALVLALADALPMTTKSASPPDRKLSAALTEQRNPRTMNLDRQSVSQLVATMLAEESRVIPAIRKERPAIERAIITIVTAFKSGGRLFYVGAGTSGRLGVLDASECPPTFSTDPAMVQGIIAGGVRALHSAVEAAEDDVAAGAEAIHHRGVGRNDVVVGIAASGSTPFVFGALDEARQRGAKTFLLCFSKPASTTHPVIWILTGPEALTGSTRLKAGTATKLVLNMLTTISMIRLGKVVGNLMVDVKPNSEKLRDRACRIVAALKGCEIDEARRRLERAGWNVKRAVR